MGNRINVLIFPAKRGRRFVLSATGVSMAVGLQLESLNLASEAIGIQGSG